MENINYYKNIFAIRLKELMDGKNVTAFAIETGITERTINSWLKQKTAPRTKHLILLSVKYKTSINYLVGLENNLSTDK